MESLQERIREEIGGWEQAYPLRAFPEPDLARAAAVLKDASMTLDAISASNMRHVASRLAPFIHEAADALDAAEARIAELEGAGKDLADAARSEWDTANRASPKLTEALSAWDYIAACPAPEQGERQSKPVGDGRG